MPETFLANQSRVLATLVLQISLLEKEKVLTVEEVSRVAPLVQVSLIVLIYEVLADDLARGSSRGAPERANKLLIDFKEAIGGHVGASICLLLSLRMVCICMLREEVLVFEGGVTLTAPHTLALEQEPNPMMNRRIGQFLHIRIKDGLKLDEVAVRFVH